MKGGWRKCLHTRPSQSSSAVDHAPKLSNPTVTYNCMCLLLIVHMQQPITMHIEVMLLYKLLY